MPETFLINVYTCSVMWNNPLRQGKRKKKKLTFGLILKRLKMFVLFDFPTKHCHEHCWNCEHCSALICFSDRHQFFFHWWNEKQFELRRVDLKMLQIISFLRKLKWKWICLQFPHIFMMLLSLQASTTRNEIMPSGCFEFYPCGDLPCDKFYSWNFLRFIFPLRRSHMDLEAPPRPSMETF